MGMTKQEWGIVERVMAVCASFLFEKCDFAFLFLFGPFVTPFLGFIELPGDAHRPAGVLVVVALRLFPNQVGDSEGVPIADDEAQGGGEAFLAQAFLFGELADDTVVDGFEVDHAVDVADVRHRYSFAEKYVEYT